MQNFKLSAHSDLVSSRKQRRAAKKTIQPLQRRETFYDVNSREIRCVVYGGLISLAAMGKIKKNI